MLLLFGSVRPTPARTAWALRGQFAAFVVVGGFALVSRLLPHLLSAGNEIALNRLSYPITYWNGLGILLGLGVILGLHLASSEREPAWVRIAAAAAEPVLATALYLTLSRGAIVAVAAGLVVYLVAARPWGALAGLLAVLPSCALALVVAYDADLLVSSKPETPAAIAQGKHVALYVGLSMALAAILRIAGLPLDRRLRAVHVSGRTRASLAPGQRWAWPCSRGSSLRSRPSGSARSSTTSTTGSQAERPSAGEPTRARGSPTWATTAG